jgi:type I restriction enzyme M protein
VHDAVAKDCPAYETEIQALLDGHEGDVPEESIPEAVADLIVETFNEPEIEEPAEENGDGDNGDDETTEPSSDEERITQAEEKLDNLRSDLIRVKQKLDDLGSDLEALEQQKQTELESIEDQFENQIAETQAAWSGTKTALNAELKPIKAEKRNQVKEVKAEYGIKLKDTKAQQKNRKKSLNNELKRLEKEISAAEHDLKLLTNRGKLELVLEDSDMIGTLKERWIAAEVAKRLDYPIFMAVSERGGKNNSGDYEYVLDEDGHLVEDASGQPKIDQDLVNYDLTADELADAAAIADDQLCVAEAFVRFAQQQGFDFWGAE